MAKNLACNEPRFQMIEADRVFGQLLWRCAKNFLPLKPNVFAGRHVARGHGHLNYRLRCCQMLGLDCGPTTGAFLTRFIDNGVWGSRAFATSPEISTR